MYTENELFDILNEDGTKAGFTKPRSEVHRDGDWHGSVHIWVTRRRIDGVEVLLQKRAEDKDSYPGCYDAASTGHIDAGEDAVSAAVREIGEEIGIFAKPSDFILLFRQNVSEDNVFHGKRFINNEINWVYLYTGEISDDDVECEQGEVAEVVWRRTEDVLAALEAGDPDYCVGLNELREVMKYHEEVKP